MDDYSLTLERPEPPYIFLPADFQHPFALLPQKSVYYAV